MSFRFVLISFACCVILRGTPLLAQGSFPAPPPVAVPTMPSLPPIPAPPPAGRIQSPSPGAAPASGFGGPRFAGVPAPTTPNSGSGFSDASPGIPSPAPTRMAPPAGMPAGQISGPASAPPRGTFPGIYHDGAHHFSFDPPSNWAPMQSWDLQNIVRLSGIPYLAGYRMAGAISPYLLIQTLPAPSGNPSAHVDEMRQQVLQMIHDPAATVDWDEGRKALVLHASLNVPGAGSAMISSYWFPGSQDVIIIHCYQMAADGGRYSPTFEQIASSFQFDPGYGYESRGFLGISWHKVFAGAHTGAISGGIAGALIGIFIPLLRRNQRRRP